MGTKETISPLQMSTLLLVYTTGSTIIFIPSSLLAQSGNAFWLAWLVAGLYGALLLSCMLYLRRRYPGDTLVEGGIRTVGYPLTIIIMIPFLLFMILLSAYIYFSIGAFFTTTMMRDTPAFVFNGLIALVSALTVRAGILVMARMFTLLNILLIGIIVLVMLLNLENYHPNYLLPVMPNGIKPVFHSVYQIGGFLYGDFLVFSIVFAYMRPKQGDTGNKPIAIAFLFNWFLLVLVCLCVIMGLGPMTNEYQYPLYTLSRVISIQEIIERAESIIGMSMIAGSYMKSAIMLFALNAALTRLLRLKDDVLLVFPLALVGYMLSLVIVENEADFGEVLMTWPMVTFTASLPIYLVVLISLLKKRSRA